LHPTPPPCPLCLAQVRTNGIGRGAPFTGCLRSRRNEAADALAERWRIAGIGTVMTIGTLAVLDAYYPGGLFTLFATCTRPNAADEAYSRTMGFTTLILLQLFNVYNCRSTWRSAFSGFFENRWLIGAVALSLFAHVLAVYEPFLQAAFHTVALSMFD
jgi:P-type Ca2+ transporter type 2C